MLRNEHYLGYIVFGKKKRKKVVENGIIVDKWTRNESYGLYLYLRTHLIWPRKDYLEIQEDLQKR